MFFDLDLFCRQSKGVFYLPWITAIYKIKTPYKTTGLIRVTKKNIVDADLVDLGNSLLKYLLYSSADVSKRVSLRLGAILLNGLMRIHHCKVVLLLDDCFVFYANIERPIPKAIIEEPKKAKKPKPKVDGKKTSKKPAAAPIEEFQLIQEIRDEDVIKALRDAPQVPPEVITLPDDVQIRLPEDDDKFGDEEHPDIQLHMLEIDFSTVEPQTLIEQIRAMIFLVFSFFTYRQSSLSDREEKGYMSKREVANTTSPQATVLPTSSIQEEPAPQISDVGREKRRRTSDEPATQPSKRGRTEDESQVAPEVVEPQVQAYTEVSARKQAETEPSVLQPIQRKQEGKVKKSIKVDVKKVRPAKTRIQHPSDEVVSLDTIVPLTKSNAKEIMDVFTKSSLLLAAYQCFSDDPDITMAGRLREMSSLTSLQRSTLNDVSGRRKRTATPVTSALEDTVGGERFLEQLPITPIVGPQPLDVVPQIIEPEVPQHQEIAVPIHSTPKKQKRQTPPRLSVTEISEFPPAARRTERQEEILASPRTTRQANMKDMLSNWNFDEHELTIEDLCPKPINRLNISSMFFDLLVLHKMRYVELCNKPDSIELGCIKRGTKLKK